MDDIRNAFSAADLPFLTTLAGQIVTAIERARLYEDLEKQAVKLAEEVEGRTLELQAERDRMLAILDSAGEGFLFTDVDARILYVNPALEWQMGFTREEWLGKRPNMWQSPKTDGAIFDDIGAWRSGAPGTGLGLAISKVILENCGGGLELDSVPGEEALYTVWLPAETDEEGAAR